MPSSVLILGKSSMGRVRVPSMSKRMARGKMMGEMGIRVLAAMGFYQMIVSRSDVAGHDSPLNGIVAGDLGTSCVEPSPLALSRRTVRLSSPQSGRGEKTGERTRQNADKPQFINARN